jgi:superfamily I DNA and/or RNA helicase
MTIGQNPVIQYPIHLLSKQKIPENLFNTGDDSRFRVFLDETPIGLSFNVVPNEAREVSLQFSLPKYIYTRYLSEGRMLEFKNEFIDRIELPTIVGRIRRILRLNLDREWTMQLINQRR